MLATVAGPAAAQGRGPAPSTGSFIVVYEDSVRSPSAETDERERDEGFDARYRYGRALKGFAARLTAAQVRRLEADPEVAYVAPDRPVRALGSVPLASGEPVPPTGVRRIEAATATSAREASSANVAVIDTGVDLGHPDLNAADGKNCITAGATAQDDNGHGTHVAGTVAGKNNGAGVVGVAPGTKVYGVKVLNGAGSGSTSSVVCGIDWVTANAGPLNIKVANMSLGGSGSPVKTCSTTTDPEHAAICRSTAAGVTYAVAAGNDGWDFDYASVPDVPAAYPEVLTVTAVTDSDGQPGGSGGAPACRTSETDDRYASFSNYAATTAGANHTIAAPGTCIQSTWPGGGYNTISGTSMATPHMAGAIALCLGEGTAAGPCAGLTPAQIVQKMRSDADGHTTAVPTYGFTGDPVRPVSGRYYGYLDWSGITSGSEPPPPPPPPAPAPTSVTATPGATSILSGSLRSGSASSLTAADSAYYQVNSTTSGTRTSAWYGSFSSVSSSLANLKLSYQGANSRTCAQTLALFDWTTNAWVVQDSRNVGTTQVKIADLPVTGTPGSYVSGTGELRVRVRCTTSKGFYSSGNWMKIAYDRP